MDGWMDCHVFFFASCLEAGFWPKAAATARGMQGVGSCAFGTQLLLHEYTCTSSQGHVTRMHARGALSSKWLQGDRQPIHHAVF